MSERARMTAVMPFVFLLSVILTSGCSDTVPGGDSASGSNGADSSAATETTAKGNEDTFWKLIEKLRKGEPPGPVLEQLAVLDRIDFSDAWKQLEALVVIREAVAARDSEFRRELEQWADEVELMTQRSTTIVNAAGETVAVSGGRADDPARRLAARVKPYEETRSAALYLVQPPRDLSVAEAEKLLDTYLSSANKVHCRLVLDALHTADLPNDDYVRLMTRVLNHSDGDIVYEAMGLLLRRGDSAMPALETLQSLFRDPRTIRVDKEHDSRPYAISLQPRTIHILGLRGRAFHAVYRIAGRKSLPIFLSYMTAEPWGPGRVEDVESHLVELFEEDPEGTKSAIMETLATLPNERATAVILNMKRIDMGAAGRGIAVRNIRQLLESGTTGAELTRHLSGLNRLRPEAEELLPLLVERMSSGPLPASDVAEFVTASLSLGSSHAQLLQLLFDACGNGDEEFRREAVSACRSLAVNTRLKLLVFTLIIRYGDQKLFESSRRDFWTYNRQIEATTCAAELQELVFALLDNTTPREQKESDELLELLGEKAGPTLKSIVTDESRSEQLRKSALHWLRKLTDGSVESAREVADASVELLKAVDLENLKLQMTPDVSSDYAQQYPFNASLRAGQMKDSDRTAMLELLTNTEHSHSGIVDEDLFDAVYSLPVENSPGLDARLIVRLSWTGIEWKVYTFDFVLKTAAGTKHVR